MSNNDEGSKKNVPVTNVFPQSVVPSLDFREDKSLLTSYQEANSPVDSVIPPANGSGKKILPSCQESFASSSNPRFNKISYKKITANHCSSYSENNERELNVFKNQPNCSRPLDILSSEVNCDSKSKFTASFAWL